MSSSLYGIYTSENSLAISQAAMDVINNNVSNMNTPGYSKQSVQLSEVSSLDPTNAAQVGSGAVLDAVTRNRDAYLDNSFRQANASSSYYSEYSTNATQMENTVNELGDTGGINSSLSTFYNDLSQLAANPSDATIRNTTVQNASTVATTFNNDATKLQNMRTSLVGDVNNPGTISQSKLSTDINALNSQLSQVASLNQQIALSTSQGENPNALLDQRDQALDTISQYIPINITTEKNNTVSVSLGSTQLINGNTQTGVLSVQQGDANNPSIVQITDNAGNIVFGNAYSAISSGEIGAILQLGGSDPSKLTISGMLGSLNTLANQFSNAVNTVQANGRYINNTSTPNQLSNNTSNPIDATQNLDPDPQSFFVTSDGSAAITAGNISVNSALVKNPGQIAAASISSGFNDTGDGSNALLMSQVQDQSIQALGGITTQGYITNMVGQLGTQSANLKNSNDTSSSILQQVTQRRDSVTGVSLDQELSDLVMYQKSYEASAKIMTTMSDNLTTIINMIR